MEATRKRLTPSLRLACRADVDALVEIDYDSFSESWSGKDFRVILEDHEVRLVVAAVRSEVAGYALWWVPTRGRERHEMGLLRVAVAPGRRRKGVGASLLRERLRHLHTGGLREQARASVAAGNLEAQLFLRECGWLAEGVVEEQGEEWIPFVFKAGWPLPGDGQ